MKYEVKSKKNRDAVYERTVTSLNMYKAVLRNLFFVLVCSISSSCQISPKNIRPLTGCKCSRYDLPVSLEIKKP